LRIILGVVFALHLLLSFETTVLSFFILKNLARVDGGFFVEGCGKLPSLGKFHGEGDSTLDSFELLGGFLQQLHSAFASALLALFATVEYLSFDC